MGNLPLVVAEFVARLPANHVGRNLAYNDPIVRPLEYFLNSRDIRGRSSRLDRITNEPINKKESNAGKVAWASICAELGAAYLISHALELQITGYDQVSPRSVGGKRDCDIRARINGIPRYFEVKRNSVDDTHLLPDNLAEMLADLDINLVPTAQLTDTRFKCRDPRRLREVVLKHLAKFPDGQPLRLPEVRISFHDLDMPNREVKGAFNDWTPASIADIRSWLMETGRIGRDGKPMTPMVKQAEQKGADYLVSRIEGWDSLTEVVEGLFPTARQVSDRTLEVVEPRIGHKIIGILLFNRYDKYVIVQNGLTRRRKVVLA